MDRAEAKETARTWKRRGREEVDRLVSEYRASGKSVREFAAEHDVKECTLRGWLYRRQRTPVAAR
jgi:transposase-like protein